MMRLVALLTALGSLAWRPSRGWKAPALTTQGGPSFACLCRSRCA